MLTAILFFFFGILAGWTNENMAVALVPCLILIMAYLKYTYSGKLPLWMYAGLMGAAIGTLLLILAPGNFVRLGLRSDILPVSIRLEEAWSSANKILLFSTIVFIVYGWVKKACTKQILVLSSILAIYAFLALGAMIISPEFPPRAWFGIVTLMIIVCGMILANLSIKEHLWYKRAILFISFVSVVFFAVDYIQRIPYMRSINRFWKGRAQIVKEAKEQGEMDIVFSQTYNISYERHDTADMTTDIEDWRNKMYKKYWGLNSVRISEDAKIVDMKRYYKKK